MAPARGCSLRHLLSCAAHTGTAIRPCESRGIPAAPSRALIVTPSPSALATRVRVCLAAVRTFLVRVFLHLFTFNLHARIRTPQTAGSHPTMPTPPKTTSPECILLLPSEHRSALALKDSRSAASNRLGTVFAVFQQFCLLDWAPCTRRATSSLFQAFSPPHSEGYNTFQGPHILYDLPSFPACCD
jgi:hypothetical protein